MAWLKKKEAKFCFILLLSYWMDYHHWKGYTGVQPKDKATLWVIYFWTSISCDYLSLTGLFSNSVTYQILLNKILLILTKRGSQWKQRTLNWHWDLKLYSYALCSCCLLYLHCLSSVARKSETHWCFEVNSSGERLNLMYALHWFFEPQSSTASRQTKPSTAFYIFFPKHKASNSVCQPSPAHFCLWKLIKSLLK